jgi:hypothetical protein
MAIPFAREVAFRAGVAVTRPDGALVVRRLLGALLKFGVTAGIFVGIFLEFGGGYAPVSTADLEAPDAFAVRNPAYPGIVGRVKARLAGTALPPALIPVDAGHVCDHAGERPVFVRLRDAGYRPFKALRHCGDAGLATVYRRTPDDAFEAVPWSDAPPTSSASRASNSSPSTSRSCGRR